MCAMGIFLFLLPDALKSLFNKLNFIFWLEWIAVWAFSAAWLEKGQALLADSFENNETVSAETTADSH